MPSCHITDRQVRRYMASRKAGYTQAASAARAGFSESTAFGYRRVVYRSGLAFRDYGYRRVGFHAGPAVRSMAAWERCTADAPNTNSRDASGWPPMATPLVLSGWGRRCAWHGSSTLNWT